MIVAAILVGTLGISSAEDGRLTDDELRVASYKIDALGIMFERCTTRLKHFYDSGDPQPDACARAYQAAQEHRTLIVRAASAMDAITAGRRDAGFDTRNAVSRISRALQKFEEWQAVSDVVLGPS